jgi:predicted RNase H-like HicB family nuclease
VSPKNIAELMAYGWQAQIERLSDGQFHLTIPPLTDFELFGSTQEELEKSWSEALESHLLGYLAVGKAVPLPSSVRLMSAAAAGDTRGASEAQRVVLDENLQPVS